MKRFCIINLLGLEESFLCEVLQKRHGPTRFYIEREPAEAELFRLQKAHPAGEFYLFEAVGVIRKSAVNPAACHLEDPELL